MVNFNELLNTKCLPDISDKDEDYLRQHLIELRQKISDYELRLSGLHALLNHYEKALKRKWDGKS